jgi:GTP-binding protein Era
MAFHSGFVSIIGRPNAGKSTLLNGLVGEKLAIVTHKPQTTRNRITGIVNVKKQGRRPPGQIVFVDTPGVHKPTDALNKRMMQEVQDALVACDLVLLMIDVSRKFGTGDEFVLDLVKRTKGKTFLLLNKIDLVEKSKLLPMIEQYSKLHDFAEVVPISAEKKQGLEELVTLVVNVLPEGPKYFPEDQVTDQPERFVVAEFIREQVLVKTKEEVPYASGVAVERFEDGEKLVKISAAIFVEREGQKGIIIGKHGAMLKSIGTHARLQIERLLGKKVFLELFVKVREGWRNSSRAVDEAIDWRKQLEEMAPKKLD